MLMAKRRDLALPWDVVVPIKDTRHGKSRLAPAGVARTRLSRAIADDTVAAVVAAVGAERTWLVTSDSGLAQDWSAVGVAVLPDPGRGLNAAIAAGLAQLPPDTPRAALLGDLPSLTAADLVTVLTVAEGFEEWFVPDAEGTGTVLRGGRSFVPQFGPRSAAAHARQGAVRLDLDLPRLRRDVDDAQSLAVAVRLGLGSATSSVLDLARHARRDG